MARSASSFRRGVARLKAQPTTLVICEDSKSARRYLEDASVHFRVRVHVEIAHVGRTDPKGIVLAAIERTRQYDRIFCTIDRDNHPSFSEALALGRQRGEIVLVPSYPCFEFWYLLHFGYTRKAYSSVGRMSAGERLIADLRARTGMGGYAKGSEKSLFEFLLPAFPAARKLSRKILAEAHRDGEMNPSTRVHELMDYFEALSHPKQK